MAISSMPSGPAENARAVWGAADDDVGLLLLAVTVAERRAEVGPHPEVRNAEVL
jgi:hypothetical protein